MDNRELDKRIFTYYGDSDKSYSELNKRMQASKVLVFQFGDDLPQKGDSLFMKHSNGWLVCSIHHVTFGRGIEQGFCVLELIPTNNHDLKEADAAGKKV